MKLNFDEVSPITGNKCVLVEKGDNKNLVKLCTESGFITYTSEWQPGQPAFDLLGFMNEPCDPNDSIKFYYKIRKGKDVLDPLLRRPDAHLAYALKDKEENLWLPNFRATLSWCLHCSIRFGGHYRWGISPILYVEMPSQTSKNTPLLSIIEREIASGDHYTNPTYGCMSIIVDEEESKVHYHFADYTKARWYDDYKSANEAFEKLNNNG